METATATVAGERLAGGGFRDTVAPAVWKCVAERGPDLVRQGSPRIMSHAPHSSDVASLKEGIDQMAEAGFQWIIIE